MVDRIDHIVLNVSSIQEAKEFYGKILGLDVIEFSKDRFALSIGDQKINLHEQKTKATPKAKSPSLGTFDVCFISQTPLDEIKIHLEKNGVELLYFDVPRTGAIIKLRSLYFYDRDGNLIEISNEVKE
jgi:catechol 2,3-dioxygenase-like lactoylglutathione lyase family enzyme